MMPVTPFFLSTAIFFCCFCCPLTAQPPVRSATTKVLQTLELSDKDALIDRLQTDNQRIREQHIRGKNETPALFDTDDRSLYFSLLYLSYYGRGDYGLPKVRAWLERQQENGAIPADTTSAESQRFVTPWLAQIILLGSKQQNNFTWLQERPGGEGDSYYERLKRYLDYWRLHRDTDGNGLPAWRWPGMTGLIPDSISTLDTTASPVESVALVCLLYREYRAMALLAHQLRRPEEVDTFHRRADALAEALNACLWQEQDGFYYDRHEKDGAQMAYRSAAGLLPLFAGIVPYRRADRLVQEQIREENAFWTTYPIPLDLERSRKVWVPANYMIFQGLMDYGYRDLARSMAVRSFELAFRQNQHTRSYYKSQSGAGRGQDYASCSSLAYLMPWEYELNYTPSTMSWQPLFPLVQDYLGVTW